MKKFWDQHYENGKASGFGDTSESQQWKMKILFDCGFHTDKSIIDIGCGDMVFWEGVHLTDYTGIDISSFQIEKNMEKYHDYKFYCANSATMVDAPRADIVICFDMLFHIMKENDYIQTLENIASYGKNKLFIYTWGKNPFESFKNRLIIKKPFGKNIITDDKYQYYRDFRHFSKLFLENDFDLVNTFTDKKWKYGELFYYEKKMEE